MIFPNAVQTRFFRACRNPYLFAALTALYLACVVVSTDAARALAQDSLKVFLVFALAFCVCSSVKKQSRAAWIGPLVLMCTLYPASVYLAGWVQGVALPPDEAKLYRLPLFFIWLPFFVRGSRFDLGRLGAILYGIMLLILLWTTYTVAYLGMKRMDVDAVMGAVIIYDGMLLTLVLLGWVCALAQYGQGRKTAGWLWTVVACAAISAVVLHGSRGAWLGIPVVLLYLYGAYRKQARPLWRLAAVWLTVFFVWLGVSPHSPLQQRVAAAGQEVAAYEQGQTHSSVGARLAMWQFAWQDFQSALLAGVGAAAAQETRCRAHAEGTLAVCYAHAHSMYFQVLSAYGVLGLTGLLALFGVPLVFLLRRLRAGMPDAAQTQAAHMGVVLVLYTATASLTDLHIGYSRSLSLYCFLMALLLHWVAQRPGGVDKVFRQPDNQAA